MIYKTVKNYPEYAVSKEGVIINKKTGHILKPTKCKGSGCLKVTISGETKYVHRLVADTYLENPDNKSDVMHLDKDKRNNDLSNLRWATHRETQRRSYDLSIDAPGGNEPPKPIFVEEWGATFPSIRSCARETHVSRTSIRKCINGELDSCKGLTFKLL